MKIPSVYHHTGLEHSGGATRVARLLMEDLVQLKIETNLSFELAEDADGTAILPEDFGRYIPKDAVAHIHCTGNWVALLGSVRKRQKTVITLHDCELFTGGCPYPLDCPDLEAGCLGPCPRNFPDSAEVRRHKLEQIRRLQPVLVAPSRWLGRLAKAHLHQTVNIIPNGIPWPERPVPKPEARRELGIHPSARVALFVAHGGMNAAYKSGDVWLDMWESLKARIPELVCFAVGGDREERQGDFLVWPYVDRNKLSKLMAAADVLLYPTRADNHSLVVLEAMAHALPVVSYGVGGVPEQLTDGYTGLVVPSGDQDAFVERAAELLRDASLIRQMGTDAFHVGQKRFYSKRMALDYYRLYSRFDRKE